MKDLSASWVLENPVDEDRDQPKNSLVTQNYFNFDVSIEIITAKFFSHQDEKQFQQFLASIQVDK